MEENTMKLSHLFCAPDSSTGIIELMPKLTTTVLLLACVAALPVTVSAANTSSTDFNVDIEYIGGFLTDTPLTAIGDADFFFEPPVVNVPFSGPSPSNIGTGSATADGSETVSGGDNSFLANITTSTDASATGGGSRYTAQQSVDVSLFAENISVDELDDSQGITLEFSYDATWLIDLTNTEFDDIPRGTISTFSFEVLVDDISASIIYEPIWSVAANSSFTLDQNDPNFWNYLASGSIQIPLPAEIGSGADIKFKITNISAGKVDVAVVPLPAAVWLFGSGLLGLIGIARRKKA